MSLGRAIKRRVNAAIPPLIFLALTVYFGWSATQGDRGLKAYAERQIELKTAEDDLSRALADQAVWERRVGSLNTKHLDLDALDERSRDMLNRSDPNDIVVPYGDGKRLF